MGNSLKTQIRRPRVRGEETAVTEQRSVKARELRKECRSGLVDGGDCR